MEKNASVAEWRRTVDVTTTSRDEWTAEWLLAGTRLVFPFNMACSLTAINSVVVSVFVLLLVAFRRNADRLAPLVSDASCRKRRLAVCDVIEVQNGLVRPRVPDRLPSSQVPRSLSTFLHERGHGRTTRSKPPSYSTKSSLWRMRLASAVDATSLWESLVSRIQVREGCW